MALLALLALTEGLLGGQSQNHEPAGFGKGMEVWREADLWGREWPISGYFLLSHRNIAQACPFLGLPASLSLFLSLPPWRLPASCRQPLGSVKQALQMSGYVLMSSPCWFSPAEFT